MVEAPNGLSIHGLQGARQVASSFEEELSPLFNAGCAGAFLLTWTRSFEYASGNRPRRFLKQGFRRRHKGLEVLAEVAMKRDRRSDSRVCHLRGS